MIDFIQYLPYKGNYPQLSSLNDQSLRSLSPEYLFNGEVNEKTDIWGFGCILVCFCFFLGIALVWIDYGYSSLPDQQHSFHLWLFHSLFWPSLQWDHSSIFSFFPFDIYRVIKMLLCILIRMRLTTRFSIDITYSSLLLSSHSIEFFYSSTIKVSSTVHLSNKQESIIPTICIFHFLLLLDSMTKPNWIFSSIFLSLFLSMILLNDLLPNKSFSYWILPLCFLLFLNSLRLFSTTTNLTWNLIFWTTLVLLR